MSYVLQNDDGQIAEAHSISAGLDYPSVGPEHAYYKDVGRFQYASVTDAEALEGFQMLARLEGIMPALESAHAVAYAMRAAAKMKKTEIVVVGLSGRGDKDCADRWRRPLRWERSGDRAVRRLEAVFTRLRERKARALIPYFTAGDPSLALTRQLVVEAAQRGADVVELGSRSRTRSLTGRSCNERRSGPWPPA
jgi:hypothetical protein